MGVLGQLRVEADGEAVKIGGARLRGLVTRLAVEAGRPVGVEALTGALWPDGAPAHPAHAVHSLVARLRRVLPDRSALRSLPLGYQLDLGRQQVDVLSFEDLAAEGHRALRGGDARRAVRTLTEALGLWRGDAMADVPQAPYVVAAVTRLDGLRLQATEDRIEAELISGSGPGGAVPELEALITTHPLRERLRSLLLMALQAEGREAEALRAYEDYRLRVADELGTDPGSELRELHLRLLRGEEGGRAPAGQASWTPWTSLVGRDDERTALAAHLAHDRLITVTGPGGVGKTRLATSAAADWAARRPGRSPTLIDLAQVTEPPDLAYTVAAGLGVKVSATDGNAVAGLSAAVAGAEAMLVLDNCEHLVDAAAHLVDDLLGRCPRLRIMTTSREPLGLAGEVVFPVPPLGPGDAVRLFADRARAARPGVEIPDLPGVCRRLDGLPLAIELAAARLRTMSPEQLAERLADRFGVLTRGSRTDPERHRTLRAVVEWSWNLLGEAERDAIERLAVFPAGFGPDVAERIGIALEVVDALVDKSLLRPAEGRYRMLDTIREYGVRRLSATGRLVPAQADLVSSVLDLVQRAQPHLRGAGQLDWLVRLAADRENLNAALRLAIDNDRATAVRIGSGLGFYWLANGDHAEAVERMRPLADSLDTVPSGVRTAFAAGYLLNAVFTGELAKAAAGIESRRPPDGPLDAFVDALVCLAEGELEMGLAATEAHLAEADPWTRALLHLARAFLQGTTGHVEDGGRDLSEAAAAFRAAGDRWGLGLSLMSQAATQIPAGAVAEAVPVLDEATVLARELGNDDQRVWLAGIRLSTGDLARARAELLDVTREARSARHIAIARVSLADIARIDGDLDLASERLRLAEEYLAPGDAPFQTVHQTAAGFLAIVQGRLSTAADRLRAALGLAADLPDPPMAATVGVGLGWLLIRRAHPQTAATVLGAADRLRGGPDAHHPDVARLTGDLQADLGRQGFQDAYDVGLRREMAEALDLLRTISEPPSSAGR